MIWSILLISGVHRIEEVRVLLGLAQLIEQELDGNGRVVVRYSGTEALARVMIEAESKEQMERLAEAIVGAIRTSLGA